MMHMRFSIRMEIILIFFSPTINNWSDCCVCVCLCVELENSSWPHHQHQRRWWSHFRESRPKWRASWKRVKSDVWWMVANGENCSCWVHTHNRLPDCCSHWTESIKYTIYIILITKGSFFLTFSFLFICLFFAWLKIINHSKYKLFCVCLLLFNS